MGEPPPFDPCECIFSPAGAMRRLISLLRQSQNYCTDEQCFGEQPGPQSNGDTGMTMFMMFVAWVVLAATLYLFRPTSIRDGSKPASRDHDNDHNDGGGPRTPPPVM